MSGLKVPVDRRINLRLPKLDCDLIRDEFAFAGVIEKGASDFGARIDRAKDIAAGAMKKAGNRAERAALVPLPLPGAPKRR